MTLDRGKKMDAEEGIIAELISWVDKDRIHCLTEGVNRSIHCLSIVRGWQTEHIIIFGGERINQLSLDCFYIFSGKNKWNHWVWEKGFIEAWKKYKVLFSSEVRWGECYRVAWWCHWVTWGLWVKVCKKTSHHGCFFCLVQWHSGKPWASWKVGFHQALSKLESRI